MRKGAGPQSDCGETEGEKMTAQMGKTEGEREKWGKGKQVKMKQRKRKRETDAENGSQRNHNMLTVRQKHGRWISRREMRGGKGRRYDAVEMDG